MYFLNDILQISRDATSAFPGSEDLDSGICRAVTEVFHQQKEPERTVAESQGHALALFCNGKHDFARYLEANIANIWTLCHYLILPIRRPLSLFVFSLYYSK